MWVRQRRGKRTYSLNAAGEDALLHDSRKFLTRRTMEERVESRGELSGVEDSRKSFRGSERGLFEIFINTLTMRRNWNAGRVNCRKDAYSPSQKRHRLG